MIKIECANKYGAFKKSAALLYIIIFTLLIAGAILFSGCEKPVPLINTPTPIPTYTAAPSATPVSSIRSTTSRANIAPSYDETYPIPKVIGNTGANIENGGLSISDRNNVYFIDNGIWRMSRSGSEKVLITDMQNISCLNNVGEYIYFLSAHDGTVYKVEKAANSVPESLNITGADSLVVIDDFIYYNSAIGEESTNYMYKSSLNGIVHECLFIRGSYIVPDGAYFYFNNLDDDGSLWRYDTIASQTVKISDDKASQINIIEDKLYYINQDLDYNVVSTDRNGLNQVVIVTQGCTDLNIIQNYLIYRTIDTGYIQSYNIKTGETVPLVSYGELFSLNASGTNIFFQIVPTDGFDPETYIFDIVTSTLNKSLPKKIYAFIKDIDLDTLTFDYDSVHFYKGRKAAEQYSAYNSTSLEVATEMVTTDDGMFYIYNKSESWIRCASHDWLNITLIRRTTSLACSTPYTADLAKLQALFDSNPDIEGKLLFELTIIEKKAVKINEVYYTLNIND